MAGKFVPGLHPIAKALRGWPSSPNAKPHQVRARSKWKEHAYLFRHDFAPDGLGTIGTKVGTASITWTPEGWSSPGTTTAVSAAVQVTNLGNKVTAPCTIVLRIKMDSFVSYATLWDSKTVYNGNGLHIYTQNADRIHVRDNGGTAHFYLSNCWTTGEWTNIVVRHDGSGYLALDTNGPTYGKVSYGLAGATVSVGSSDFIVGAGAPEIKYSPDGTIAAFRFIEAYLSDAEVNELLDNIYYGLAPANQSPFLIGTAAGGGVTVTPNNASHAHSADQPTLTQAHTLSVNEALHDHTAKQPLLIQAHILVTDDATHGHTADEPLLTGAGTITPDDAAHAHAADQPTLVQAHILAVLSATHAHTADGATLTVGGALAVDDALHGHLADSAALTQAHQLSPEAATHAHTGEQPGLTQAHVITPAEASHGHTADQPTLDLSLLIVANDANHAHSVDQPSLTQAHVLAVQNALHAQLADQAPLYTHVTLVADDALHAHLADNAALIVGELLTPSGRVFLVRSDLYVHLVHGERRVHLVH